MPFKITISLLVLLALCTPLFAVGQSTIVLTNEVNEYFIDNREIDVLEDSGQNYSISDILSPQVSKKFVRHETEFLENKNPSSAYWIRFKLSNKAADTKQWLLESFNYRINDLDFYIPDGRGNFIHKSAGVTRDFSDRVIQHKNLEFTFNPPPKEEYYYLRYSTEQHTSFQFVIRSVLYFTSYALTEYFMLGVFYGMILVVAVYNLFLFFSIRDRAYLYYVLYALSFGVFSMTQDGTGFQYLWPNLPQFNTFAFQIFLISMTSFLLLYSKAFLYVGKYSKTIKRIINFYIILRLIAFVITLIFFPHIRHFLYTDLLPFIFAYIISILSFYTGFKSARFFIAGFSTLLLGFFINHLRIMGTIPSNVFTVYSFNAAAIIEMILLSLALGDRIKELREREMLNLHLEEKVKERTNAILLQKDIIKEKIEELDSYMYRTAHDIKGPLKSIKGLANLGVMDVRNSIAYFEHIKTTVDKLEAVVKDLLYITRLNKLTAKNVEINFTVLVDEVLAALKHLPEFDKIRFDVKIEMPLPFYSEKTALYSVIQNLIENAIKYRMARTEASFLKITIKSDKDKALLEFEDNGIGIPQEHQDKIFNMFFKLNHDDHSSGLGLYIVKLSVEKLKGTIQLKSSEGQGTTFSIILKNHPLATTSKDTA